MLSLAPRRDSWRPPVVRTVATTGEGVGALREALEQFRLFSEQEARRLERQREQWRARLLELLRQSVRENAVKGLHEGAIEAGVEKVMARRRDPHSVVEELVEEFRCGQDRGSKKTP